MLKKIDKFVFWVRINSIIILALFIFLYGILYGLSYINFDIDTSKIVNYMNIICYIIFFFYKQKDKFFKLKYFLCYVIVSFIVGRAIDFLVIAFSIEEFIKIAKISESLSFFIISIVLESYLEGFLYQTFKEISYKRNNN